MHGETDVLAATSILTLAIPIWNGVLADLDFDVPLGLYPRGEDSSLGSGYATNNPLDPTELSHTIEGVLTDSDYRHDAGVRFKCFVPNSLQTHSRRALPHKGMH